MHLKSLRLTLFFLSLLTLTGCQTHFEPTSSEPEYDSEITIYSGVTMIRPLKQLADEFSAKHNVKVNIHQGASGFLYRTLKKEPQGDIYFPGSNTYRTKSLKDGLISEYVFVGYNRIAMIVAKGNPKKLTADLRQLTNLEYSVVLVPPNAGSIGRSCKRMLDQQGLTNDIYDNVTYFTTDSSRLVKSIVKGDADIALNWYAASKWPEVKDYVDSIQLDNSMNTVS